MNKNELHFINRVNEKYGIGTYTFEKMLYINAQTKVELKCTAGEHYFTISPCHMVSKSSKGCNKCQKNTSYSTEEFIEIISKKYDYLSFEKTVYVPQRLGNLIVTCHSTPEDPHDWIVNSKTLLQGKTHCGICSGKVGRSTEQFIKEAITIHGEKYDYTKVVYAHSEKYIEIICKLHGEFKQTPKAHLTGRGCPKCGKYGYQPSEPGYFYIQKLESGDKVLYKYGITGDLTRRINEQSRTSIFKHSLVLERYYHDGNKAFELEKKVKKCVESGVVGCNELPDGFSETFNENYLDEVLKIVNTFE